MYLTEHCILSSFLTSYYYTILYYFPQWHVNTSIFKSFHCSLFTSYATFISSLLLAANAMKIELFKSELFESVYTLKPKRKGTLQLNDLYWWIYSLIAQSRNTLCDINTVDPQFDITAKTSNIMKTSLTPHIHSCF